MSNTETAFAQAAMLQEHQNNKKCDHNSYTTNPLTVWSWERLSFRDFPSQEVELAEGEGDTAYQAHGEAIEKRARWAWGRVKAITTLLKYRHGGPCDTDDAEVWIQTALPFVIDAAELTGRSAFIKGLKWVRKNCPGYVDDNDGYERTAHVIQDLLEIRDKAEAKRRETNSPWAWWTPTMLDLKTILRPTWSEITCLHLRGWACIDRPLELELKARATAKRREKRRAEGARPQSERTKTADLAAIAVEIGKSLRTLERWSAAGTLDAKLAAIRNVGNLSDPYRDTYGTDTFPTRPVADNDNLEPLAEAA